MQLLRVPGVTTGDLHTRDEFGRQVFWNTTRHAFEGQSVTTKMKLACHWEPVKFPKERRDVIIFTLAAHNTAGKVLSLTF